MKVYDESPAAAGTTPSRKVSFRKGRTPLQAHNHQKNNATMQSFRNSLHGRDGLKKASSDVLGRKTKAGSLIRDKENVPTPGSAQALRRSLRATVSSQPSTTNSTTTFGSKGIGMRLGTSLGPAQRVIPKTPNSLLRTELDDDDLEESLLVSPPGALWNVLDTSSTGLVVVSPQAAGHIHQAWSAQKQTAIHEDAIFSPPKPRTLLSSRTPVTKNSDAKTPIKHLPIPNIQTEMNTAMEVPIAGVKDSDETVMPTPTGKSVCMDMTSMFSDGKKDKLSNTSSPPARLLNRLEAKNSSMAKQGSDNPSANSKPAKSQWPLSLATATEARTLQQPKKPNSSKPLLPTKPASIKLTVPPPAETPVRDTIAAKETTTKGTGNGISMDMSSLFGKESVSVKSKATPPPHLLARLSRSSKPVASASRDTSSASSATSSTFANTPKTKVTESNTVIASATKVSGNGMAMDMTEAFTTDSVVKQKAAPPPHLLARLSRPKKSTNSIRVNETKATAVTEVSKKRQSTSSRTSKVRVPAQTARTALTASKPSKESTTSAKAHMKSAASSTSSTQRSKASVLPHASSERRHAPRVAASETRKAKPSKLGKSVSQIPKKPLLSLDTNIAPTEKRKKVLSPTASMMNNQHLSIGKPVRVPSRNSGSSSGMVEPKVNARGVAATKITEKSLMSPKAGTNHKTMSKRTLSSPKAPSASTARLVNAPSTGSSATRNGNSGGTKGSEAKRALGSTSTLTKQVHSPVARTPKSSNMALQRRQEATGKSGGGPVDWADKQCESFVAWLEQLLNPMEEQEELEGVDVKTRMNMRGLLIHRRLAHVRFRASELFHGEEMRKIKKILHGEIFKGQLSLRADRELHADLGLRNQLISLLLSYTTPWLRLGLEVFFGECIEPEPSTSDDLPDHLTHVARMRSALRKFVLERVLSDADILAKYTRGRCTVPSGKFEKQYNAEMRVVVLYRILVLVFFLDRIKMANVLDKVPRLFGKKAANKSSESVLYAFCRSFLSSEGNFVKHLSRIGLKVSFEQEAVDELEYRVLNIATDLRDGVRLTRMTEILTEAPLKSLMKTLRVPAVSRLQKLYNVNVALAKLKEAGILIPEDVIAHHIVDGHREMNLKLMWAVIAHCCLSKLLEDDLVEEEITRVLRSNQARRRVQGIAPVEMDQATAGLLPSNSSPEGTLKSLLLRWCSAVCSSFGLEISDFSDCFADGKALCFLIHYYHPSVVRRDEILPTTRSNMSDLPLKQAILNERKNSTMASRRIAELGGIPKMVPVSDTETPPDEKSVLLCLSFMCSRLMESSKEIFATILIQSCYRRYRNKILLEKKVAASQTIMAIWRQFKQNYFRAQRRRYADAVATIERFALARKLELQRLKEQRLQSEREQAAGTTIQTCFRGYKARRKLDQLLMMQRAALKIQGLLKIILAKKQLNRLISRHQACVTIQTAWRQFRDLKRYYNVLHAAIEVQRVTRGFLARNEHWRRERAALVIQQAWWNLISRWEMQSAALAIQTAWRGTLARKIASFHASRRDAACNIQRVWRGHFQLTLYSVFVESAVLLQSTMRGYLSRKNFHFQQCSLAAIKIQSAWRSFAVQVQFEIDLMDIVAVQAQFRCMKAKRERDGRLESIAIIQNAFRRALARRAYKTLLDEKLVEIQRENAALTCQCAIRCWLSRMRLYNRMSRHYSVLAIQSQWRRHVCEVAFFRVLFTATKLQSLFRGRKARETIRTESVSARKIQVRWRTYRWVSTRTNAAAEVQRCWRGYYCRDQLNTSISAARNIQRSWRGYLARNSKEKQHFAARILQCNWRSYWAKMNYDLDVLEVIISQSVVRRYLAQKEALRQRHAILTIQKTIRKRQAAVLMDQLRYERTQSEIWIRAVVTVQSMARRYLARNFRKRATAATLRVQSSWRRFKARCCFKAVKTVATGLQAAYRGTKERRLQALLFTMATRIQTHWRGFAHRVRYMLFIADVTTTQSIVRRRISTKLVAQRVNAILSIQKMVRIWMARRNVANLLSEIATANRSATVIQSMFRVSFARASFKTKRYSIIRLQAVVRRFVTLRTFSMTKSQTIVVQSVVRRHFAKRCSAKRRDSIVTIQLAIRQWAARAQLRHLENERQKRTTQHHAALVLQSCTRGFLARKTLCSLHKRATLIQSVFRGYVARACYELNLMDIVLVQSIVRRHLVSRSLRLESQAACTIQKIVRRYQAEAFFCVIRLGEQTKNAEWNSATKIQSHWRGHASRVVSQKHAAARNIQKTWRCFIAHIDFLIKVMSTITIQSSVRRFLVGRKVEAAKKATVKLQALVRASILRKKFLHITSSTRRIQANFRACIERKRFAAKKEAAIIIQKWARGFLVRNDLDLANFAASEIQRIWRGYIHSADFTICLISVIQIQCLARKFLARTRFESLKLEAWAEKQFFNKKASTIQGSFRLFVRRQKLAKAATMIQTRSREFLHRRTLQKVRRGVIQLQSHARAIAVRRQRSKKVVVLASRVAQANEQSAKDPRLRLGHRTTDALEVLKHSKSLAEIMKAVETLEAATRLSIVCCEVFTGVKAAHILLDLIKSCNRSVPHVELVFRTLLTLDNVAQHAKLLPSFADCAAAEIFLDMVLMFRDNNGIFCLSVSLLGRIADCNPAVMKLCSVHEHLKRLNSVHHMSVKKLSKQSGKKLRLDKRTKERKEIFDIYKAVKALGKMVKSLGTIPDNHATGEKHFVF